MDDVKNESLRKRFETWAEPRGFMIESYQGSTGEWFFSDDDTQLEFECWQAATSTELDAQRLRADTAEAALLKFDEGIRALACSLGVGGYNAEILTADQLVGKVQWGIDNLLEVNERRIAAAEQRIADLLALIEKAHTWVDRNNCGGWDAYELRDELHAAALNSEEK